MNSSDEQFPTQELFDEWKSTLFSLLDTGIADPLEVINSQGTRKTEAILIQATDNQWLFCSLVNFEAILVEAKGQSQTKLRNSANKGIEVQLGHDDIASLRQLSLSQKIYRSVGYHSGINEVFHSSYDPQGIIDILPQVVEFAAMKKAEIQKNSLRVAREIIDKFKPQQE